MNRSTKEPRGFTLIELLVVIAIIAILAAILFPVFARARENARKSTCQSNLKQIAMSAIMYRQDFDEVNVNMYYGPIATNMDDWVNGQPVAAATGHYSWMIAVLPYIKNAGVFRCPSLPPPMSRSGCANYLNYRWSSYGMAYTYVNSNGGRWVASIDANVNNASCIMFSDGCGRLYNCPGHSAHGTCGASTGWTDPANLDFEIPNGAGAERQPHLDGGNYAFYDGHVKWMKNSRVRDYCPKL